MFAQQYPRFGRNDSCQWRVFCFVLYYFQIHLRHLLAHFHLKIVLFHQFEPLFR